MANHTKLYKVAKIIDLQTIKKQAYCKKQKANKHDLPNVNKQYFLPGKAIEGAQKEFNEVVYIQSAECLNIHVPCAS